MSTTRYTSSQRCDNPTSSIFAFLSASVSDGAPSGTSLTSCSFVLHLHLMVARQHNHRTYYTAFRSTHNAVNKPAFTSRLQTALCGFLDGVSRHLRMLGTSHDVSPSIVSGAHPAAVRTRTVRRGSVDIRTFQRVLRSVSSARSFCITAGSIWISPARTVVLVGCGKERGTNVGDGTCAGGHKYA